MQSTFCWMFKLITFFYSDDKIIIKTSTKSNFHNTHVVENNENMKGKPSKGVGSFLLHFLQPCPRPHTVII